MSLGVHESLCIWQRFWREGGGRWWVWALGRPEVRVHGAPYSPKGTSHLCTLGPKASSIHTLGALGEDPVNPIPNFDPLRNGNWVC